jgi:DNA polymerase III sliding clamp (beta) subunit (PCNA family)
MAFTRKRFSAARSVGYRSGLEVKIQDQLKELGVSFKYEKVKIEWEDLMYRKYTPDFILPNNIIVEVKGLFTASDRRKHLLVKKQHDTLDIRFVFENSKRRLSKVSKTTYADWCVKHGFLYADKEIPTEWIEEKKKHKPVFPALINYPYKRKDNVRIS